MPTENSLSPPGRRSRCQIFLLRTIELKSLLQLLSVNPKNHRGGNITAGVKHSDRKHDDDFRRKCRPASYQVRRCPQDYDDAQEVFTDMEITDRSSRTTQEKNKYNF